MAFLDRLMNQGNIPLLEQQMKFAGARMRVLADNIANVDTPNYVQKDLSVEKFQQQLRDRVAQREGQGPGTVRFEGTEKPIEAEGGGILFHDRNNRSIETLMSDMQQNGMKYTMFTELLRKQFNSIQDALKERVT